MKKKFLLYLVTASLSTTIVWAGPPSSIPNGIISNLQNGLTAEATSRQEADANLQSELTAEVTARQEANTDLQNGLITEITTRQEADADLQAQLTAEVTARQEKNFNSLDAEGGSPENALYVNNQGYVGIGTTNPEVELEVVDVNGVSGSPLIRFNGRAMFGYDGSSGANAVVQGNLGKGIEFNVNSQEYGEGTAMVVTNQGNVGIGTRVPQARLDVAGAIRIQGADVAEQFPFSDEVGPGMVVAIDPDNPGKLHLARGAYNTRVAGIVSGANGLSAGAILGNMPGMEHDPAIALSGRVWCLVDTESGGPVNPGDILTTSDTPGHAMRVTDHTRAQGAVLGKAMTKLENDRGLVLVLVTLQ